MKDAMSLYMDACRMESPTEKLTALMECAEQEEDEWVCKEARYKVGIMFWNGDGTEEDKEVARELIESSADMGFIQAMEFLAQILKEEGDLEGAVKYETRVAENKLSEEELIKIENNIFRMLGRMKEEK